MLNVKKKRKFKFTFEERKYNSFMRFMKNHDNFGKKVGDKKFKTTLGGFVTVGFQVYSLYLMA